MAAAGLRGWPRQVAWEIDGRYQTVGGAAERCMGAFAGGEGEQGLEYWSARELQSPVDTGSLSRERDEVAADPAIHRWQGEPRGGISARVAELAAGSARFLAPAGRSE